MMCYKDKTFCGSDCTNTRCYRHFGENEASSARRWWGKPNPPVAYSDYSDTCLAYTTPNGDKPNEQATDQRDTSKD